MGLDTSHDAWHGAYSAFHRWRCEIARVAGLPPLDLMEGFWGDDNPIASVAAHEYAESERMAPGSAGRAGSLLGRWTACGSLPIRWDSLKPDPALHALLHHSDCDGEIAPDVCAALADRLEELLPKLGGDLGGHIGDVKAKTAQFIAGCRAAAAANEPLDFH